MSIFRYIILNLFTIIYLLKTLISRWLDSYLLVHWLWFWLGRCVSLPLLLDGVSAPQAVAVEAAEALLHSRGQPPHGSLLHGGLVHLVHLVSPGPARTQLGTALAEKKIGGYITEVFCNFTLHFNILTSITKILT